MLHVRPYPVDNAVIKKAGLQYCPYCCTPVDIDICDPGWVESPFSTPSSKKYICLGCCEDIYSVCVADEFLSHPYLDYVKHAASIEHVSLQEFRIKCLMQQLDSAADRKKLESTDKYDSRARRIKGIIDGEERKNIGSL